MSKAAARITLASRHSPLAMRQAETVACAMRRQWGVEVNIIGISTRGDEILDRPLAEAGGKALFIKGLQEAVAAGDADIAVHSLKDMEAQTNADFTLAAVGFGADCRDAVISRNGADLAGLAANAVIGTCSPRRGALLKRHFPHLLVKSVRGNLQTRLAKLAAGEFDALLLAAAGLVRLQMQDAISAYLPLTRFIPAVGQGLLGLECAADNTALIKRLATLNDAKLRQRADAERAFSAAMEGDCHTALGAYAAAVDDEKVLLHAFYAADDGGFYEAQASATSARAAGESAAEKIYQRIKYGQSKITE